MTVCRVAKVTPLSRIGAFATGLLAMVLISASAQSPLTNGAQHTGDISPAGDSENWTFTAPAGTSVMLRVGATNFTPRIRLFGPANEPIADVIAGNSFVRDGVLTTTATNAGNYTVIVSAASASQTGTYGLHAVLAPGSITVPSGDQGGELVNGAHHTGEITLGDLDAYQFQANAGDGLMVRMGGPALTPWLRLIGPTGALVAETKSGNSFTHDGFLNLQATNAGTYTLIASATYERQIGSYGLSFARAPGPFVVSSGDQGGTLTNGFRHTGSLGVGELDVWGFTANAGDGLMMRMGAAELTPWLRLFGPTGALVAETTSGNGFTRDGSLALQATNAGNYTLVVSTTYNGQSGDYRLSFAQAPGDVTLAPGDQGGDLTNGATHPGDLDVGDIDVYRFEAFANQSVMVRIGSTDFTPWLRLYGPNGALIDETTSGNGFVRDGVLTTVATNAGIYTVAVSATYSGQAGPYQLSFVKTTSPLQINAADEGGELVSGTRVTGNIDLGDLDAYQFEALSGQGLILRMGATNVTPWLRLYGPNGALIANNTSGNSFTRDGSLALQATNAGLHTLVVSATYNGQSGGYALELVRAATGIVLTPGDEGGNLINGFTNVATLDLGDLDVWSFIGTPGDSNVLRVVATNFTPWIRLYGPTGALVDETTSGNSFTRSGAVSMSITNEGLYTVVVAATYAGQSGTYTFKQSRVPPDLIVPETQVLDEGATLAVGISAQDPDEPNRPLTFTLISGPPNLAFAIAGPTNATLAWPTSEVTGPATNEIVASVTDVVNGKPFIRTNRFTVVVNEINQAPHLVVPANQTLDELTTLQVSASATDDDLPANTLRFSLVAPPDGMSIDPVSGAITWTPTEAQGPSSQTVSVVVTDDNPWAVNAKAISVTNQFTVTVREINLPPSLTIPGNQVLDENTPLSVKAGATDLDLPANALAFRLVAPPAGAAIDPVTGAINWTPTEAQGPTTNVFTVVVSDSNPGAANTPQWNVTNAFQVVVREVNTPPAVTIPGDRSTAELAASTVPVVATDADLPATTLLFQLLSPPTGMTIDPASGVISWTPTEAQGPSTNRVTFVVSETTSANSETARLSVTNSFQWIVTEVNTAPVLDALDDQTLHYGVALALQAHGTDVDLPANTLRYSFDTAPDGMSIDATTGAIAWNPTQGQVGQHTVTVRLSDQAATPLAATRTFQVTVTGEGANLVISQITAGLIQISATGDIGATYELQGSTDLNVWTKIVDFQSTASPYLYIDPSSLTSPNRFYRLLLRQ
ncbi:MAG: putative Ig domain-containing protein [Verrucomicrobiales bacterium]|nr:putative Ig domain-containing protein [Verrucomicrobiales bacterium]